MAEQIDEGKTGMSRIKDKSSQSTQPKMKRRPLEEDKTPSSYPKNKSFPMTPSPPRPHITTFAQSVQGHVTHLGHISHLDQVTHGGHDILLGHDTQQTHHTHQRHCNHLNHVTHQSHSTHLGSVAHQGNEMHVSNISHPSHTFFQDHDTHQDHVIHENHSSVTPPNKHTVETVKELGEKKMSEYHSKKWLQWELNQVKERQIVNHRQLNALLKAKKHPFLKRNKLEKLEDMRDFLEVKESELEGQLQELG